MLQRAILESARQDGLIDKNPAGDRRITNPSHRKTVRNALPVEDVKTIIEYLNALDNIDDRRCHALLIFTRMRCGEVLGLRWENIDLQNGVIHVLRNMTFPKGMNEPYIGTSKTESGVRDIPFLLMVLDYLKPQGTESFVLGGERPTMLSMHRRGWNASDRRWICIALARMSSATHTRPCCTMPARMSRRSKPSSVKGISRQQRIAIATRGTARSGRLCKA